MCDNNAKFIVLSVFISMNNEKIVKIYFNNEYIKTERDRYEKNK